MRIEDRFLHNCITLDFSSLSRKELREIAAASPDWGYMVRRAKREGLVSIVYQVLLDEGLYSRVPLQIWQDFERGYYTVAARNSLLLEDLKEILGSLLKEKIEVILLKGMALLMTVYSNPALRPMYDIDLLIRKKDTPGAKEVLTGLGYTQSEGYPEDFYKGDMMVDLHTDLINTTRVKSRKSSCAIDLAQLWAESRPLTLGAAEARVLSAEDFLISLSIHLSFHHGMQGLMWFCDICRLIQLHKDTLNWQVFIRKALSFGIAKPVYYVLLYIHRVLGQDIPFSALEGLRPKQETFIERKVIRSIVEGRPIEHIRFFFTLSSMDNFFDRAHFLREIALPSPRVIAARYGLTSWRPLPKYYLLHFKAVVDSLRGLAANLIRA